MARAHIDGSEAPSHLCWFMVRRKTRVDGGEDRVEEVMQAYKKRSSTAIWQKGRIHLLTPFLRGLFEVPWHLREQWDEMNPG